MREKTKQYRLEKVLHAGFTNQILLWFNFLGKFIDLLSEFWNQNKFELYIHQCGVTKKVFKIHMVVIYVIC